MTEQQQRGARTGRGDHLLDAEGTRGDEDEDDEEEGPDREPVGLERSVAAHGRGECPEKCGRSAKERRTAQ
jgi:hypothetical protein